ncbi:MAG TPA: hypothetical protein VK212_09255 [Lentimicrobium sp.]|nr:hypothetical protein [Lentimicrobium sp.]
MILIADSGSTKTDWLLINGSNNTFINTSGINAYYMSSEAIADALNRELTPALPVDEVRSIYFYGSGCSTKSKCDKISHILTSIFHNAIVEVNHDMLAAARALCKNRAGIACILGTGSNSCVYDGSKITRQMVSLGYFFGDEGSGTHLGKLLINDFLKGEIPAHISEMLIKEYSLSLEFILDHIYNYSFPNRFLASFSKFIERNITDPYLAKLVAFSFNEFFKVGIKKFTDYKSMEVSFVGSIAYYFQDILLDVANQNSITVANIQRSVIEGLKEYHTKYISSKISR